MPNAADAKKAFARVLRENGFQGSAPTFRRFEGKDAVAVVNLQASRMRPGGTYVNLGVHRRGLEKRREEVAGRQEEVRATAYLEVRVPRSTAGCGSRFGSALPRKPPPVLTQIKTSAETC